MYNRGACEVCERSNIDVAGSCLNMGDCTPDRQIGRRKGKPKGQLFQEERKSRVKQIVAQLKGMVSCHTIFHYVSRGCLILYSPFHLIRKGKKLSLGGMFSLSTVSSAVG